MHLTMPWELYREVSQEAITSKQSWTAVARAAFRFYLDAQAEARRKDKEIKKDE
jgi:hypothetical protein